MSTRKNNTTRSHKTTSKTSPVKSITKKLGKKGGATMAAGTVGAVVGGAIGAAAGVLLTNDQRREKAIHMANSLKNQAVDVLDQAAEQTDTVQKTAKNLAKNTK